MLFGEQLVLSFGEADEEFSIAEFTGLNADVVVDSVTAGKAPMEFRQKYRAGTSGGSRWHSFTGENDLDMFERNWCRSEKP